MVRIAQIVLLALLAAPSRSEEPVALVTGPNYAPFADAGLPAGGMLTDLVTQLFGQMGRSVKIDWEPWARGYERARSHQYAATFPYVPTPERQAEFLYSDAMYEIRESVFARPGTPVDPARLDGLKGKSQCLPIGWARPIAMSAMMEAKQVSIVRPTGIVNCMRMIAGGRADFVVLNRLVGEEAVRQAGFGEGHFVVRELPTRDTLHLIISRTLPQGEDLLAQFNKALKAMKASGGYDEIVKRHANAAPEMPAR